MSDHPGVIAPPPLIFAGFLVLGLVASYCFPFDAGLSRPVSWVLGGSLAFVGAAVVLAALGLFRLARTRPEPWQPTTAMVTRGIYAFTRNPMYLGMALAHAGIAVMCGSVGALLLLLPALLVIHYGVILREERYLGAKFGTEYQVYARRVRRWL